MPKSPYEQHSILIALEAYLTTKGWTNITYRDGYKSQDTITNPQCTVRFLPSNKKNLQLGRVGTSDQLYRRKVQIDAYMENEPRAGAIMDDIMDFMDLVPIDIIDPNGDSIGSMVCYDTDSIIGEILPPATALPQLLSWRVAVKCDYETHLP